MISTHRGRNFQQRAAIETGLSDFHKMVLTVLKASLDKQKQNEGNHIDCKKFCGISPQDLQTELAGHDVQCWDVFQCFLDEHAIMKKGAFILMKVHL